MKIFNVHSQVMAFVVLILLSSCGPSKKAHEERLYLRGIDTSKELSIKIPEQFIQKGDILSITVFSDNPEATTIYNQVQSQSGGSSGSSGATSGGASASAAGYLVDVKGDIYFHSLGLIKIEGLTKLQLSDLLKEKLNLYLKNPYVEIRFLNARVTVIGEVAKPGTINIPEQRISVLDAIALSGDLTGYGRRDNILVVRERDGKREAGRLDLRNPAIYQSDFFYLQQNDMVYIEPIRKKPTGSEQLLLRNVAIGTSIVSTLAILISLFR